MYAEPKDLDLLLEIQKADLVVLQAKKKRAELPQRIAVMRLRKKRDEIQAKLDQVLELKSKVDAKLTEVEDEDRALAEKQQRAQEIIDAAGSDYRKVESHSKEMAGVAKRRDTLAEKTIEITEQLDKVNGVRTQLEGAIATADAEEAKLRAAFEEEDNALIEVAKNGTAKRTELIAQLPQELAKLYEQTSRKHGGVAIGKLDDDRCGICRSVLEGGRLIELRASAPLGTCPTCKRLLVVEKAEA